MKRQWILGLAIMGLLAATACSGDNEPASESTNYVNDEPTTSVSTDWDESVYLTKDVLYPRNSKLKREYRVRSDGTYSLSSEYQYDNLGRISKILYSTSGIFLLYEYDAKGLLSSISRYDNDQIISVIIYSYDDVGNKTKEETKYVETSAVSSTISYIYDETGKLVKSEHLEFYDYIGGDAYYIIEYEYNSDNEMIIERLSVPGDESAPVITKHFYKDGLLYYSVTHGSGNYFLSDKKRIYDLNGNLVKTITDMPGLSSTINEDGSPLHFYETRAYEYE
ncbi:MAG: hypothetical protein LBR50_06685 [Tannerella sp.]|jgi:hypothetical protein|nr:hypothetical protein [Tannerella sp.]